jgi:predicted nicotinamide N-methyase
LRAAAPPAVPEILIYQAGPRTGLWDATGGEYRSDQPPPFWAFAWAGGQALARHLLDHPDLVRGRHVLDVGAGSGLVAIAAARAGATRVRAAEIDPDALVAIGRNAALNGVAVEAALGDPLDGAAGGAEVVVGGDVFYTAATAGRMMRFLRRAQRAGALVLVGDAERGHLPAGRFTPLASYRVPVPVALEGSRVREATVFELAATPVRRPGAPDPIASA